MLKNEKKLIKIAAILYIVLIILIYFGSYLKYLLSYSWLGTASVITIIFIWVTIFFITVVISARVLFFIKVRLRGKERLDFVAKYGSLVAEYAKNNKNKKMQVAEFFILICKENGIMKAPDIKKYSKENFGLKGTRERVFESLRQEIEDAANEWSRKKKKDTDSAN
jgi:hypothetical protein